MNIPRSRQNFLQEISQPDDRINLTKAALYIAQEEYPNLDIHIYLNILDGIANEIEKRLPPERYPLRTIQIINQYLYDELGYTGNNDNYYDPRNSFLNEVIDRRTGIPITLSLVYLEIARRLDFPLVGINMPGHFLIRPEFQDVGIFVDTFNRGEILFEQDCETRLTEIYGYQMKLQASFTEPVSHRQLLARMLTNLKLIYLNRQDLSRALATVELILLLFPEIPRELRDRGLLYYQLGYSSKAYRDLGVYLAIVPNADDADIINRLLQELSREI
ncbi:SirB1 family protein [Limnofasciculus baicalensis]|uniref:SirB1 family protein n=1 Tax=Limnofasciculus baicalensis BBK-W-15 TaxID=2699891 RepID=A0AAE3GS93_9CYAN|nr:SirB1 family protein [Limnofasciculus baicalensis]MCP2729012.1 SirB1 family protein [Limnofasciculus baicalensis BBK-W-15]